MSWMDDVTDQVWGVMTAFRDEVRRQGLLPLLRPVAPFNRPDFLAPALTVGAIISGLVLAGVALGSLGTFLTALLALYLLLVQVFGVSIEVHPFGAR